MARRGIRSQIWFVLAVLLAACGQEKKTPVEEPIVDLKITSPHLLHLPNAVPTEYKTNDANAYSGSLTPPYLVAGLTKPFLAVDFGRFVGKMGVRDQAHVSFYIADYTPPAPECESILPNSPIDPRQCFFGKSGVVEVKSLRPLKMVLTNVMMVNQVTDTTKQSSFLINGTIYIPNPQGTFEQNAG